MNTIIFLNFEASTKDFRKNGKLFYKVKLIIIYLLHFQSKPPSIRGSEDIHTEQSMSSLMARPPSMASLAGTENSSVLQEITKKPPKAVRYELCFTGSRQSVIIVNYYKLEFTMVNYYF